MGNSIHICRSSLVATSTATVGIAAADNHKTRCRVTPYNSVATSEVPKNNDIDYSESSPAPSPSPAPASSTATAAAIAIISRRKLKTHIMNVIDGVNLSHEKSKIEPVEYNESDFEKKMDNKNLVSEFEAPSLVSNVSCENQLFDKNPKNKQERKISLVYLQMRRRKKVLSPVIESVVTPNNSEIHENMFSKQVAVYKKAAIAHRPTAIQKLESEFSFYMKDVQKEDITIGDFLNMRKSWSHVLNDNLYMFHMLKQDGMVDSSDCLSWVYDTFYKYAYEYDDSLRTIFHENLKIQSKALMNLIQCSIRVARDVANGQSIDFHSMYKQHKLFGITVRHYFEVINVLLITFRDCMGNLYCDTIEESWNKVMSYILNQIILEDKKDSSTSMVAAASMAVSKVSTPVSSKRIQNISARLAPIVSAIAMSSK
jgi:hemoglobin-like flavoprotein